MPGALVDERGLTGINHEGGDFIVVQLIAFGPGLAVARRRGNDEYHRALDRDKGLVIAEVDRHLVHPVGVGPVLEAQQLHGHLALFGFGVDQLFALEQLAVGLKGFGDQRSHLDFNGVVHGLPPLVSPQGNTTHPVRKASSRRQIFRRLL